MEEVKRDIYYSLIKDFEWIPFTQADAYCRSIVPVDSLHYFIDNISNPQIGIVGFVRRKAGLTMLCLHGECLKDGNAISRKQRTAFYDDLRQTGYDMYELNLNTHYSPNVEIALRRAGWLRPVGAFSTTLSKLIPLAEPREYDKSWRRNLKTAHTAGLTFSITSQPSDEQIKNYADKHAELLQRKHFSGDLTFDNLKLLFSDLHFRFATVSLPDGTTLSGGIVYVTPNCSSFIYSYTTIEGRKLSASYMLYEGILAALEEEGISSFDMGRLSPATHEKDKLFLFKDGVQGQYVQYVGEWEWCNSWWQHSMLYLMKKYIWKRVQV